MACSKIFTGYLPELTNEIIQNFRKDFSTLHSCILVNRFWCRLAIPLLWEDPFSIPSQNYRCIEIYLHFLNEDSKAKFNEYENIKNLIPTNTLFNYPSFTKYLSLNSICSSVEKWVATLVNDNRENLERLVYKSLFEVLLENEGNLHSFEFVMSRNGSSICTHFNNTMELILQHPNFICNIKNLALHIFHDIFLQNTINIIPFLKFLYSNCNSISSIVFHFRIYNVDNFSLIEKCLSQLIISQHNLKIISFIACSTILYKPFLSLKNSNCSDTLNTIIFDSIDFRNVITVLQEVFDQLNVLESIHILYCYSLNSDFVQQIIKVNKPFKLKSLFIDEILHIESLQLLLQKCGDYLENFEYGYMIKKYEESRRQLLKLVMKYCTKIIYFTSDKPDDINIYLLIENIGQTINYLTILMDASNKYNSIVLQNLGQVLPSKLEYLYLSLSFSNDFETFLKNSQNTFIKKLLIRNMLKDDNKIVLFYIKEYIMRKKRVKYLAFSEFVPGYSYTEKELFFLKDEVNEFKLYNIIVQKHRDLYISQHDIVNINIEY
ncbi:hypothetical protein RhiirB3_444337 [Rhizophagus irregularis]|nr:hypothetical protein RhiirB3_444337 [Rhizophagus irregularis]